MIPVPRYALPLWLALVSCEDAAAGPEAATEASGTTRESEEVTSFADATSSTSSTDPATSMEGGSTGHAGETDESGAESGTTGALGCAPAGVSEVLEIDIADMQADVVAALSGATEIAPGVTLGVRWSNEQRAIARDWLAARLEALGLRITIAMYSPYGGNVAAIAPATDGGLEYVIFGAHFDTELGSPGAGDNATGVAMILAAAELAANLSCRGRNVVFVMFDEEEKGLVGSRAFVESIVAAGWDVHSAHTVDMVSWDADGDGVLEVHRPAEGLLERYESASAATGLGVTPIAYDARSSDHTAFREAGFPAVGLMEEWQGGDTTPHYHQPTDTFDKVDLPYLEATTRVVMQVVVDLATGP